MAVGSNTRWRRGWLDSLCRIRESVSAISMGSSRGFLPGVSVTVGHWSLHIHGIMPGHDPGYDASHLHTHGIMPG